MDSEMREKHELTNKVQPRNPARRTRSAAAEEKEEKGKGRLEEQAFF